MSDSVRLYLVHRQLLTASGKTIPAGSITSLSEISERGRAMLLEQGKIAVWRTPPVDTLPALAQYATILEGLGIVNLGQFIAMDAQRLGFAMTLPPNEVAALQELVWADIRPTASSNRPDCDGCSGMLPPIDPLHNPS